MSNGLPNLPPSSQAAFPSTSGYASADASNAPTGGTVAQGWGVFDQYGNPIAVWDSIENLTFKDESKLSNFPVESGSFATFNKVDTPFDVKVKMLKSGAQADVSQFLSAIDAARASTNLYSVVMPEGSYWNCNLVSYDFKREASKGAQVISTELKFEQVIVVTPQYSNVQLPPTKVKNAASSDSQNQGKQQAQPPTSILSNLFN